MQTRNVFMLACPGFESASYLSNFKTYGRARMNHPDLFPSFRVRNQITESWGMLFACLPNLRFTWTWEICISSFGAAREVSLKWAKNIDRLKGRSWLVPRMGGSVDILAKYPAP